MFNYNKGKGIFIRGNDRGKKKTFSRNDLFASSYYTAYKNQKNKRTQPDMHGRKRKNRMKRDHYRQMIE